MKPCHKRAWAPVVLALILVIGACRPQETAGPAPPPTPTAGPPTVEEAKKQLQALAEADRRRRADLDFEAFKATVYREPFEGGKYIVNGDTPISTEKKLREFFERNVKPPQPTRLIVHQISGMDAVWNRENKEKLTFCVSRQFGDQHEKVVRDLEDATRAWEQAAAVDFIHQAGQDGNCTASNSAVVFDVRPVDVNEAYLARAFFPNEPRSERNVLIDQSAMNLDPAGKLQLVGILRHELGHTLGFRHEHTRPASGTCFEDKEWRPLTDYDAFSVMHYPQCNGQADWALKLTERDRSGSACLYGAAAGFTIDGTLVKLPECASSQPVPAGQPQTYSSDSQSIAQGEEKRYPLGTLAPGALRAFPVSPGSSFRATIGGAGATGDADLYVRFGSQPGLTAYDCRPFLDVSNETCAVTVPPGASNAFVMVRGYSSATYRLRVTHVP
jgi:hypothetical protein